MGFSEDFFSHLKLLVIKVYKPNNEGVAGARVRILNAGNADVTATLFGSDPVLTDSFGVASKFFSDEGPLPAGTYTVRITFPGFQNFSVQTANTFTGYGEFSAFLQPLLLAGDTYTITAPAQYVSPLVPIVFSVHNSNPVPDERINVTVSHSDGRLSLMQCDLDTFGIAEFDIRSRIRLHPKINLVPDGLASIDDTDFSDLINVEFFTVINDVAIPIGQAYQLNVANIWPVGAENDLSDYVGFPRKWIKRLPVLTAFRGFYIDVMLWLPVLAETNYVLQTTCYDLADNQVTDRQDLVIPASPFVQRIRINALPDPDASYAILQVFDGETEVTEPLKIMYRG